jgi:Lrp/AsnC family transcriptional regulator, leucine-responsive regulatory protein
MATDESTGAHSLRNGKPALDEANRRLLAALRDDPRAGIAELARRIGMSPPSVRERLSRLERSGVIRGYRVDVDPAAIGLPVAAWVRIRPGPGQLPKLAALAEATPQVSECHRISGEDCVLMKVHVPTIEDLEPLLDRFLVHGRTTSSFIVATPVAPRPPSTG